MTFSFTPTTLSKQSNIQAKGPHTVSGSPSRGVEAKKTDRQKAAKFTGRQARRAGRGQAGSATRNQVSYENWKVSHGCSRAIWQR